MFTLNLLTLLQLRVSGSILLASIVFEVDMIAARGSLVDLLQSSHVAPTCSRHDIAEKLLS
jgi:hypothetical protein